VETKRVRKGQKKEIKKECIIDIWYTRRQVAGKKIRMESYDVVASRKIKTIKKKDKVRV